MPPKKKPYVIPGMPMSSDEDEDDDEEEGGTMGVPQSSSSSSMHPYLGGSVERGMGGLHGGLPAVVEAAIPPPGGEGVPAWVPPEIPPIPMAPLIIGSRRIIDGMSNYDRMKEHLEKLKAIKLERHEKMVEARDAYNEACQSIYVSNTSPEFKAIEDKFFWWQKQSREAVYAWRDYSGRVDPPMPSALETVGGSSSIGGGGAVRAPSGRRRRRRYEDEDDEHIRSSEVEEEPIDPEDLIPAYGSRVAPPMPPIIMDAIVDLTSEKEVERREEGGASKKPKTKCMDFMEEMMGKVQEVDEENDKLKAKMAEMQKKIDELEEKAGSVQGASEGSGWCKKKNLDGVIKVLKALTGQLFKHMECPLSSRMIEDAVFMEGHFYERMDLEKMFFSANEARTIAKDPFTRKQVNINKDARDGTWFNSLRTNIQHLMPVIGEDGEARGVIIDILNEYVECALTEEEKQERKEEVKKIKVEWGV